MNSKSSKRLKSTRFVNFLVGSKQQRFIADPEDLSRYSSVFEALFNGKNESRAEIKLPKLSPEVFEWYFHFSSNARTTKPLEKKFYISLLVFCQDYDIDPDVFGLWKKIRSCSKNDKDFATYFNIEAKHLSEKSLLKLMRIIFSFNSNQSYIFLNFAKSWSKSNHDFQKILRHFPFTRKNYSVLKAKKDLWEVPPDLYSTILENILDDSPNFDLTYEIGDFTETNLRVFEEKSFTFFVDFKPRCLLTSNGKLFLDVHLFLAGSAQTDLVNGRVFCKRSSTTIDIKVDKSKIRVISESSSLVFSAATLGTKYGKLLLGIDFPVDDFRITYV